MGTPEESEEKPEDDGKETVTIDSAIEEKEMEEGKEAARAFMPDLPTPLTIEEKKFLLAVERGDNTAVRKMLQKTHRHTDYMNKNCVDPLGRGALHMSIDNENLEMLELLVVMGVETRDALLHSIDVEFVEAVEVLLEHEEVIHKQGEPYSWEKVDRQTASFTPEITPLILAAHRDNYEILKILLDRGAMLPMPHDIRCGCDECIKSSSEDSLRHSMSRINSYRALASPSLIALSSTDPILTAFELSWELKTLAYGEQEFRQEYLELRRQCRDFAEELLNHTRSSTELAVILNYDPDSPPYEEGEHMGLHRLELAIDYKQKKFVAHANVQQLLAAIWYEGLPGFRRKSVNERLREIVQLAALFPIYCMHYMVKPESPTGKLMRTPFMKFLIHSSSYLFFLLLLILVSVRFEDMVVDIFGTDAMRKRLEENSRRQRGNLPTPIEFFVFFYVFGFIWEEILEIKSEGVKKYMRNMWNILDVMRDSLYISTIVLRMGAYVQQRIQISEDSQTAFIPKEEWDTTDPQLISEGLFAAANILSALKLVHIFSINPYLGPLQISLGRMVIDIVKFFFIYSLVLFAFACGLTQLLWYYNDLEKQKCYSLPGGLPDWNKKADACMKWRRFHNVFEASQSLFWAGFGMVGLSDFELTGIREYTRFWSMLMFGTYSVINIIVLLNLLIAMMSNSYSFIVEHADTEWKFARTKLWMSYFEEGKTLPPPFNILPNIKLYRKYFGNAGESGKTRKNSTRSQCLKRKARDYRYLGVMRALIWRYICALQKRHVEEPVTEDAINEVKGDISALRFELVDLFENNGMDVSTCSKKSKAALGSKMRMWERRLMRDFHVSPAMGNEDASASVPIEVIPKVDQNSDVADRFRRISKLAMMTPQMADIALVVSGKIIDSQIGRTNQHDDVGRENLKKAMDRARRKMAEDTPDNSPTSSRGCSPFSDLYTGPHLLDTINSLQLSPTTSSAPTPMPLDGTLKLMKLERDEEAKDHNLLTIPGRRSSKSLEKGSTFGELSLNIPSEVFSLNTFKALADITSKPTSSAGKGEPAKQKEGTKIEKKDGDNKKIPPVTVSTVSEKDPSLLKKKNGKTQSKASEHLTAKSSPEETKPPSKPLKAAPSESLKPKLAESSRIPMSDGIKKPAASVKQEDSKLISGVKDAGVHKSGEILQPSKMKIDPPKVASTSQPEAKKESVKHPALRIDPKIGRVVEGHSSDMVRPRPQGISPSPNAASTKVTPPSVHSFKQTPEQTELQNSEVVRRPRVLSKQGPQDKLDAVKAPAPVAPKQPSKYPAESSEKGKEPLSKHAIPPDISVIPSTPAGSETLTEQRKQMILTTKQDAKVVKDVSKPPPKTEDSALKSQVKKEAPMAKVVKEETKPKAEPATKYKESIQPTQQMKLPHISKQPTKDKQAPEPRKEIPKPEVKKPSPEAPKVEELAKPKQSSRGWL